jgi:RHS repeat-associated protein
MAQDQLYYPWGQDWSMVGTVQEKRFARLGHRDTTETGLDPTLFRMYSSNQGRWFSPDPAGGSSQDPQSFNRYGYVSGNPRITLIPRVCLDATRTPTRAAARGAIPFSRRP